MTDIAIIDYGVGNLRSIEKAFAATGNKAVISNDIQVLQEARALVLPGVGAFAACMNALVANGFDRVVLECARQGVPLIGICVGMQMLFEESSEFGKTPGLGLLRGGVRRFDGDLRVPHVGWNQVAQCDQHPLFKGIPDRSFFYFVHSYFCEPIESQVVIGETDYGAGYASVVARDNICGVQFHPEKSQASGLQLLGNFAKQALSL
ncbi:MAG TPA: imidazole glycerol phosphate synthase subunit HisH [Pyrinomonadaceae bacterium]|nr:imidazole glycerol phosphate synthase subunit HisH [Pyrinomonadaceae bacterium]